MLVEALKSEFEKRCERNPHYSVRSFAHSMNMNSGSLTQIINGKRKVGNKVALQIIDHLNLDSKKRSQILNHLFHGPVETKNTVKKTNIKKRLLKDDEINCISSWEHFAILSYLETDQLATLMAISKKFSLPIGQCRLALERLERLGLIKKNASRWSLTEKQNLETTHDIPNSAIRNAHKEYINLAIDSIDLHSVDEREIIGSTVAIDPKNLPIVKKKIRKFISELTEYFETNNKEEVYRLNLQLFPCGRNVRGKGSIQ